MRKVLGLDIGITSVGWGIIDIDSNCVVDYGVRLFKEGTAAENETRRTKRSSRRLKSRKVTRKEDLLKLLKKHHIIDDDFKVLPNPYDIRIKGLHEKLTNQELATAIIHILNHRGSSLEMIEEDTEKAKELGEAKKVLHENDLLLREGLYICEIQKKHLEENGFVRGNTNNFRTKDYVHEMNAILDHQDIEEEVKSEIIKLIQRKRHYAMGPGSFKSQTPYGVIYDENGEILVGMIDKMRGRCSLYPDELRAPKMSYSAELFNLLNDLNNLTINGEKISKEEKEEVIQFVNEKGNITPKQLAKLLKVELSNISGFRINTKDEPLLTEFKGYKVVRKVLMECHQDNLLENKDLLDDIIDVLTKSKEVEERKQEILKLDDNIHIETAQMLSEARGVSGYHAFSLKAIKEITKELLVTDMNQMQILHNSNLLESNKRSVKGKKNIVADDEAILSPVAKRAQREAMKVVNRCRELYGEFDSIVIEMTRDKNTAEQKKRIKKTQKYFADKNEEIKQYVGENTFVSNKTKEKIKLYMEQDGKCMYTGAPLEMSLIINDPTAYEVDHIIPISISLDDSINNKVLVTHKANQDKGNLTPIMAFRKGKFTSSNLDIYRANVLSLYANKKISRKKKEYLLEEKDFTKFTDMKDFINRNLVDTSYACRVVLNTLMDYFKQNSIDTKVHTIRGKATSNFRKRIKLDKDREENYGHHAIDALIVASIKKQGIINEILAKYKIDDIYDDATGEIKLCDDDEFFNSKYIAFLSTLKNLEVTKISHKIDTKPNRSIADETIYSTRNIDGHDMVVKKYKDIYASDFVHLAQDIMNHKYEDKYLMAMHDKQTFDIIKQYVEHWYDTYKEDSSKITKKTKKNGEVEVTFKKNPLSDYKEEFGMIKKYSKKGNGPVITQMKYFDGKLGNHLAITDHYQTEQKKVVLLQISPYRTDFYVSKTGVYKFVTIRYRDIRFKKSINKYCINRDWYELEKQKKKIDEDYTFVCSMHRDEIIGIIKEAGEKKIYVEPDQEEDLVHDGVTPEILKFTATNDDNKNKIEVKPIEKYESERLKPTIGKAVIGIKKYATDVLGNRYEVKNSVLKLEFD